MYIRSTADRSGTDLSDAEGSCASHEGGCAPLKRVGMPSAGQRPKRSGSMRGSAPHVAGTATGDCEGAEPLTTTGEEE